MCPNRSVRDTTSPTETGGNKPFPTLRNPPQRTSKLRVTDSSSVARFEEALEGASLFSREQTEAPAASGSNTAPPNRANRPGWGLTLRTAIPRADAARPGTPLGG
jgi:hypothetical protein